MAVDSNLAGGEFGPLAESGIPRDGDYASAFIKLGASGAVANDISALGESSDVTAPAVGVATPTAGVDEVQTISDGSATGGTFRVRYKEKVTADIAYDADAATVQVALRALHEDLAAVVCGGVAGDVTVTFEGAEVAGQPVDLLVIDTDDTTGGTPGANMSVAETTPGAYGSVSIAYVEDGGGDSVLCTVVNDATGEKFDVQVDAGTPAVCDGLPVGDYTGVFRTVTAAGRVSPPDTVAFSITSA